ncbi:MAG: ATP-dependent Clp protease ATP-binding subunit ClpX, partial [Bacteroidota bacterium]|nr:ATP-dependent Clp protease ATP-binding subunit ClpX [Bacteroidota bacterium]MDX5428824.1 ATP-dependent Clp protease ATP-binding subunit ClpX [Bacteroidota bacterium]MDX5506514.1 ATP-dependent Clp protease ATP-binding subunit ClpX [Bacteroidota bacterium]
GIDLSITDDALDYIVEKAVEFKLGARGLRSICEAILTDAMFHLPSDEEQVKELVVDRNYAAQKIGKISMEKLKAAS